MTDPNTPAAPPLGGFGTLPTLPGLSLLNGLFDFPSPGFGNAGSVLASGQLGAMGAASGPVAYGPTAAAGIPPLAPPTAAAVAPLGGLAGGGAPGLSLCPTGPVTRTG